ESQEERWDGDDRESERRHDVIDPAASAERRQDAERDADEQLDQQGRAQQQDGRWHPLYDHVEGRPASVERETEAPGREEGLEPDHVLDGYRQIEAELFRELV